jgi:biopolymer transport protein ExbD
MKINLNNGGDNAPKVEVVPLIDVIFCILTVFLLSGLQTARQQAINVDIPQAKTSETQTREMLIVGLDGEGKIFVDQQPYLQDALRQRVQGYRVDKPNGSVVLYASKQVRYERVMEILDMLRQIAGENVALATANPTEATASPAPTVSTFSPNPTQPTFSVPSGAAPATIPTAVPAPSASSPSVFPLPTASNSPKR